MDAASWGVYKAKRHLVGLFFQVLFSLPYIFIFTRTKGYIQSIDNQEKSMMSEQRFCSVFIYLICVVWHAALTLSKSTPSWKYTLACWHWMLMPVSEIFYSTQAISNNIPLIFFFVFQFLLWSGCIQRARPENQGSRPVCDATPREFPDHNYPGWKMAWISPQSSPNSSPCKVNHKHQQG